MNGPRLPVRWTLVIIWSVVALCLVFSSSWLLEKIWILYLLPLALWALVGVILGIGLLHSGRLRPAGVLALVAVLALFSPLAGWGSQAWFWMSFKQHERIYQRILARADVLPAEGEFQGVRYMIETGPPVRVAFRQPVGIADNWGAVVHDPSDAVATARGWGKRAGDYTVRSDVKGLWGGDIVSCSRITGHYYRCWFT